MNVRYYRSVRRIDRAARWIITVGGIAIIICVVGILVMIARVAIPLFGPARATPLPTVTHLAKITDAPILGVGADEYLETGFVIDGRGRATIFDLADGELLEQVVLPSPEENAVPVMARLSSGLDFEILWSDGSLSLERVRSAPEFDAAGNRVIRSEITRIGMISKMVAPPNGAPLYALRAQSGREGVTAAFADGLGTIHVARQAASRDLFGNLTQQEQRYPINSDIPGDITALALGADGATLYAGTRNGRLLRWKLQEEGAELLDDVPANDDGRAITALGLVLGDISLALGDEAGRLSTWFPTTAMARAGTPRLTRIHTLKPHNSPVIAILPTQRDKSLLSIGLAGSLHLDHMTSERKLITLNLPAPPIGFSLTTRANALLAAAAGPRLLAWELHDPHPEVSWRTLFGKVWYENYHEPAYVWQSSAATEDVEPKLSLVPLIVGTFKGTFYAMIFAVPLAVLGALYTSQFMRPALRRLAKPTVEIMAAIPSVVVGFLAALWLAPLIQQSLLSVFLWIGLMPLWMLGLLLLWARLEKVPAIRKRGRGLEFLILAPVIALATLLLAWIGPQLELKWLDQTLTHWLFDRWGVRYDQRNCIVIALALGFAAIPIIFTIADDALSNIPTNLTAASLALGASRWQTAWRVVLPSASPGIFAGIIIGFGRVVGETMIVLMATGNTPITDWSIFNGMRTLSANIAVEIPEAPVGGTLYRVLFLTAVLLFTLTFVMNTVAELVRQRLRRRYGQL